jgi:hypothetical protein
MTVAQIEIPQAAIAGFCQRYGIQRLSLFGSVLTDRFSDASDIDVLVEFLPGEHIGFFKLADIEQELSGFLGGRRIDLRTPKDLSRYFRDEVVRSAALLYEATGGGLELALGSSQAVWSEAKASRRLKPALQGLKVPNQ